MKRKYRLVSSLAPLFFGILLVFRSNGDPRLLAFGGPGAVFHGAQVLGLIMGGALLGIGFSLLVSSAFRFPSE